jgi:nitrite reductase (NO-forming)
LEEIMQKKSSLLACVFTVLILLVSLSSTACAPQVNAAALSTGKPQSGASDQLVLAQQTTNEQPTLTFTLKTAMVDGKMAFIGVSGDLAGKVNPDLVAQPGDVVEIKLVNGDGALHDLTLEGFGAATKQISGQGKESSVRFKAEKVGITAYFCSVPGHRQAGMEGRLVVGQVQEQAAVTNTVVRSPDDLPGPLARSNPEKVRIDLETSEVEAKLADGTSFVFWTFNGKVPGPFMRVRVGDTVEVHLKNAISSQMNHSIDFHAVTGPGGGAVATQTKPGEETSFTFKALHPGLYVYHCATPMVAEHIANGMYGMILVEPEGGLAKVDREFYVMQGEIYTTEAMGTKGQNSFDVKKLLDEDPEYFILNGEVGALTKDSPLKAKTGETVRIFFGVGGPNFPSSFHVIGEIFDRVYDQGSLTAAPLTNVQTTLVPPGGAAMVEFKLEVPGRYILVDHALSRMERGLAGYLLVEGPDNHEIFDGKMTPGSGH